MRRHANKLLRSTGASRVINDHSRGWQANALAAYIERFTLFAAFEKQFSRNVRFVTTWGIFVRGSFLGLYEHSIGQSKDLKAAKKVNIVVSAKVKVNTQVKSENVRQSNKNQLAQSRIMFTFD